MRELEVLNDGHLKLKFSEWKDFFEQELVEQVRGQLKALIEKALEAERDRYLQFGFYEHAPQFRFDYRNGCYFRDFATRLGLLRRLRIPRTRQGFRSQVLPRYQRRQQAVNELVRQAFLRGISTRQVGAVLEPVLGEAYSAQTISHITRELQGAVNAFHRRTLRDEYVYLFFDGVVLKVRDTAASVRRRVILVAYGITAQGRRELVDYQFAINGESEAAWTAFLQTLFLRGLEGKNLRLITSDGGKGLQAALPLVFPRVPVQLCWAHKLRNIADKVPKKEGSCVAEAAAIYRAASQSEAQNAFHHWKRHWEKRRPQAVACLERDLDSLLNFFTVPEGHWKKVRTTNVIERAFREVRRRTRPMSSFSNVESCDRIVFGVISHLNRSWERQPLPEFTQIC
ncbi:MAG TPA: IS256 family transposase [Candidatus Acidoferrales bacterium]|nr:IS256 family transposase [Candidatus Acidoferrales bacterium]